MFQAWRELSLRTSTGLTISGFSEKTVKKTIPGLTPDYLDLRRSGLQARKLGLFKKIPWRVLMCSEVWETQLLWAYAESSPGAVVGELAVRLHHSCQWGISGN